ncbi:uncharacterized protein LOC129572291 [Sitodiplosis mosellana]|uniref:uncharacterized protein LOC129572291 n=1 Tax=Sitodiplosis mosellana TaxID=263140 RepID=UPI0024443315|nr:uncharacterized protein LOC129572291 [Sitodiplosis mosellana]
MAPSKSDMLTVLQANHVEVPPYATISQIRSVYNEWVSGPPSDDISPEDHNKTIDELAKSLPKLTDETDERDNEPPAVTEVPRSTVTTTTTTTAANANVLPPAATVSVQTVDLSESNAINVTAESSVFSSTNTATVMSSTIVTNALPSVSRPLPSISVEEQIRQLQRERELLLLQQQVNELRRTNRAPVPAIRIDISAIESMVQKFSGDDAYDVHKWIEDMEDAFDILQFDERARFVGARRLLDGTAKLFARTISVHTYDELREEFLTEFGRKFSTEEVYAQLRSRRLKPSETVHRYVIEMQEIAARARVPEVELVDFIVSGIGDTSNAASVLMSATSLRDLKNSIARYERLRAKPNVTTRRNNPIVSTTAAQPNANSATVRSATAVNPTAVDTSIRCYNCSNFGHYQSACPKPKRPEGSCFRCGQMDHIYKNCPNRPAVQAAANRGTAPIEGYDTEIVEEMRTLGMS